VTPTPTPVTPTPTPVTPTPDPEFDCEDAIASGQLAITHMSDNDVTFNYTITNSSAATFNVGAASYKVYTGESTPDVDNQTLFDSDETSIAPGQTLTVSVDVPSCAHQVDVFCGPLIVNFGNGEGRDGYYGARKIQGLGFEGYFYGPDPSVGGWQGHLCK
jgi:hypothetical protein